MTNMQLEAFGEKFQSDAAKTRFRNRDYSCPFDPRIEQCDKSNRTNDKYGNCSACLGDKNRIICPRRFYEDDYRILHDVRNFIWGDDVRTNAHNEIKMSKKADNDQFNYGSLDWVLTQVDDPSKFIGVEVQSDATTGTGSFRVAIQDLLNDSLKNTYTFGFNTLSSFKGFLPQFIFKGQLFDEWKMPYVAVMQDELWDKFTSKFRIQTHEIESYSTETFLFFLYSLEDQGDRFSIRKKKIMATRWIDLLFSFAVDGKLLIDYETAKKIIGKKLKKSKPVSTF